MNLDREHSGGDREGIEALVREHSGRLKGSLRRRGLPEHAVDDVITEALLAVADKRRRGQALDKPVAFLFTVARNAAADKLTSLYGTEVANSEIVDEIQAPDMLDAIEMSEDVGRAIRLLPLRQRHVIEYRFLHDFTVAQTAQVLGIAEGTVGPTTKAAFRNLRKILGEKGGRREEETP